jgi:prefoldin subunit 5
VEGLQAASGLGGTSAVEEELASLVEREALRARREGLPEKAAHLADAISRERTPGELKGKEAAKEIELVAGAAEDLEKELAAFAERLESLRAEAARDELARLKRAAEDARSLGERLADFGRRLAPGVKSGPQMSGLDKPADAAPPEEAETLRTLAREARGIEEDMESLRRRVERVAPEALSDGRVAQPLAEARNGMRETTRSLSRNLPARPGEWLGRAVEAYQILGRGLIERVEVAVRRREHSPSEDNAPPEEFRDLVERYFRALSEDK